jgi:hypothetical protein
LNALQGECVHVFGNLQSTLKQSIILVWAVAT